MSDPMESLATACPAHPLGEISLIANDALRLWESGRSMPGRDTPDLSAELETRLKAAVDLAACAGVAEQAALHGIYPHWIAYLARPVAPPINREMFAELLKIENRYGRACPEGSDLLVSSLRRQAAILDLLEPAVRRGAIDTLMESLLEAKVDPKTDEQSGAWEQLAVFAAALNATHALDLDLPPTVRSDVIARAENLASIFAAAIRAAPPRLLRFTLPTEGNSPTHERALAVPEQASWLLGRLRGWQARGPAPEQAPRVASAAADLTAALEDWLDRSSPLGRERAGAPHRDFANWEKHFRRARLVRAEIWRGAWFKEQQVAVMDAGRRMMRSDDVIPSSAIRYARLCLDSHELGATDSEDPDGYLAEAQRVIDRLRPQDPGALMDRLAYLKTGAGHILHAADMSAWVHGRFEPWRDGEARKTIESKLSRCGSPLAGWILRLVLAHLHGLDPPAAPAFPVGLQPERLADLVADQKIRARWLAQLQATPDLLPKEGWDQFLPMLQGAVLELFGREDSAITIALVRRLTHEGQLEAARQLLLELEDRRPRTQAIRDMHLAVITLRQHPRDPAAWDRAYTLLVQSWTHTSAFSVIPPEAPSAILNAAMIAIRGGRFSLALQCCRRLRKAADNLGDPAAGFLPAAERVAFEAIARWGLRRSDPMSRRAWRQALLEKASAELANLQMSFPEGDEELVQLRRIVALQASGLPGNSQVPDLIDATPAHRLHALAVAFQRHGASAIDRRVVFRAIRRLGDTSESSTFVGAWLTRAYFEDENFSEVLRDITSRMRAERYGDTTLAAILQAQPVLVAEYIAARCAGSVRRTARAGLAAEAAVQDIERLIRGQMLRQLQPKGYAGHGSLFVDANVLRDLTDAEVEVSAPRGIWVEALFGARVLEGFVRHLRFGSGADTATAALNAVARSHEARLGFELERDHWVLFYHGRITPKRGGTKEDWKRAFGAWTKSFRQAVGVLRSNRAEVPPVTFGVTRDREATLGDEGAMCVRVRVAFWRAKTPSKGGELQAGFDAQYGLRLAELSGRSSEASRSPVSPLHTALGALRAASKASGTPDDERSHASKWAIINAAADDTWRTVRYPPGFPQSDLYEALSAATAACRVGSAPDATRNLRLAFPQAYLRLTLRTVLENAAKAVALVEGEVVVSVRITGATAIVTVRSPYVADYPKEMGLGISSVASYVQFYGGALEQGRRGRHWRVIITLPVVGDKPQSDLETGLVEIVERGLES